jgi:hypothetical protein
MGHDEGRRGVHDPAPSDRYTLPGGSPLGQDAGKRSWGPLLEPGVYERVTIERTRSLCYDGSGLAADYDLQDIAVTGSSGTL